MSLILFVNGPVCLTCCAKTTIVKQQNNRIKTQGPLGYIKTPQIFDTWTVIFMQEKNRFLGVLSCGYTCDFLLALLDISVGHCAEMQCTHVIYRNTPI